METLKGIVIQRGFGCAEVRGDDGMSKVCFDRVIPAGRGRLLLVEEGAGGSLRMSHLVKVEDSSIGYYLRRKLRINNLNF